MDIVNEILKKDQKDKNDALEQIQVNKLIAPECIARDLLVTDSNEINIKELHSEKEDYLINLARDCTQILVNTLSDFCKEIKDGKEFINLPSDAYSLPREKPIPIPKPMTKWEKFKKEKGIKTTKKPKSTWDDILQKWVPNYGYKKVSAEKQKQWLIEVPQNVDPNTDMFVEKSKKKKENFSKNEYQRLRNIAAARKIKVPKFGLPPLEGNFHTSQLQTAANIAKISTASVGKFQPRLPCEKNQKPCANIGNKKKKRFLSTDEEKKKNLEIAENVIRKKPKLDIAKAVNKYINEEQTQQKGEKPRSKDKGKKKFPEPNISSKKGKSSFKKPKSQKGQRLGKKGRGGKKRR